MRWRPSCQPKRAVCHAFGLLPTALAFDLFRERPPDAVPAVDNFESPQLDATISPILLTRADEVIE